MHAGKYALFFGVAATLFASATFVSAQSVADYLEALINGTTPASAATAAAATTTAATTTQQAQTDPAVEYAANVAKLQAMILNLTAVLADLLAKKAQATSASAVSVESANTITCTSIKTTLSPGDKGEAVRCLQSFLADKGFFAWRNVLGNYGTRTIEGVQKYQKARGVMSSGSPSTTGFGRVGKLTLRAINDELSVPTPPASAAAAASTTAPSPAEPLASCTLDGVTLAHGAKAYFYSESDVSFPNSCEFTLRSCADGKLDGSTDYTHSTCIAQAGEPRTDKSCTFEGKRIPHGQSITLYDAPSVEGGEECESEARTCTNGTLSGSFTNVTCSVQGEKCAWNNQTFLYTASFTGYEDLSPPVGNQCKSELRTCSSGGVSGTYMFPTCVFGLAPEPKSCTLDGLTLEDREKATFYSTKSVPNSGYCGTVGESRTCTDGTLSGGSAYVYSKCYVEAPAP